MFFKENLRLRHRLRTSKLMEITTRKRFLLLLLFTLMLLSVAFILQYGFHMEPCPLCIIDRIILFFLAIVFGLGWYHHRAARVYATLGFLFSLSGVLVGIRHVWLLHLP